MYLKMIHQPAVTEIYSETYVKLKRSKYYEHLI